MSKSNKAMESVAIIITFSFGSEILGFIRETLIASKYGSGFNTDTFFISLSAITLFTIMIAQSINTTMIPVLSEIKEKEGSKGKISHTNNLLNIIILISVLFMIVAWFTSPYIIMILAPGFEAEQYKLAVTMMQIGIPAIFFSSIAGVFRGYLQSELMFVESAVSVFPYNFVYILFLTLLANKFDIKALMIVSVIAIASQIIIQIPGLKSTGYKYGFILDFKDKYVKKIVFLIPPVLISTAISDLNSIVDKSMASNLKEGSISSLQYATRLDALVKGTFISAITTVIFPMLSEAANKDDHTELKGIITYGINIILLITIPASVGIIILANPIVQFAFERGAFDSYATAMTSGALIYYTIGLSVSSIKTIIYRVYYSLQDTKTPMINSGLSTL